MLENVEDESGTTHYIRKKWKFTGVMAKGPRTLSEKLVIIGKCAYSASLIWNVVKSKQIII